MIRLWRKSASSAPAIIEEGCVHLDIAGDSVPVRVRRSARASRYGLRIANATGEVVLTVPAGGDYDRAIDFLSRQEKWLAGRLRRRAGFVPFGDGALVPLRGDVHRIVATGRARGAATAALPASDQVGEIAHGAVGGRG